MELVCAEHEVEVSSICDGKVMTREPELAAEGSLLLADEMVKV
jgi:hypothetical protein